MERENRIRMMEEILDNHSLNVRKFREALKEFIASQKEFDKLKDYYTSDDWLSDYEAFNNGEIDPNLKCGVLSEDAVFDLIGENFDTAVEMIEEATQIIKNH